MREQLGSIVFQTETVMKELIQFGQSKHSAKTEFLKNYSGSKAIDKFMGSLAKKVGIYSFETFKDYLSTAISAARYAKENFSLKDISKINSEMINAFLQEKINKNLSKASIQKYCSALEKFETALSLKYEQKYNFEIKTAGFQGKEKLNIKQRSGYHPYNNPDILLKNINENKNIKETHKVAISLAQQTGLRLHKALQSGIKINVIDKTLSTVSKGGRIKEMSVSKELYNKVAGLANDKGVFKLDSKDYKSILSELEKASLETGQHYEALHGFRHNFFLSKSAELQAKGMDLKDSWSKTSKENMDHNRFVSNYTRG